MRHFLLWLSIRMMVVFCLLVGAAQGIGHLTEYPAAEMIRLFECTPQPCWHSIYPGVTTLTEAAAILSADPSISLYEYNPNDGFVCWRWNNAWRTQALQDGCYTAAPNFYFALNLYLMDKPLRFGDVLPLIDRPMNATLCANIPAAEISSDTLYVRLEPVRGQRITPELPVLQIAYYALRVRPGGSIEDTWRGFARRENVTSECLQ